MKYLIFASFALLLAACGGSKQDSDAVYSTASGALDGHDPVAYFTEAKPVKGQADLNADWNGATWHFASAANREAFQQAPEKYAPQFGGYCAYGWSDGEGHPVPTEPDAWSIVDDKLYLNYNLEVQKMWKEKQAELIVQAGQNYAKAHPGK